MREKAAIASQIVHDFNLTIDSEWLDECVQYLSNTNTAQFAKEFTQQLLFCDFSDIVTKSNFSSMQDATIIRRKYTLQVVNIKEIGVSSFQLLEELELSKKLSRKMLKVELTDGIQTVMIHN